MIISLYILGYILSVYYTRRLNKLIKKIDEFNPVWPFMWFFPVIGPLFFTVIYIAEILSKRNSTQLPNWLNSFIGRNW